MAGHFRLVLGIRYALCEAMVSGYLYVHYVNSSRETCGASPEKWVGLKSSVGGGVNRYTT